MSVLVLAREVERGLRPLDVLRDLDGIAKLISLAFAEDMARDGSNVAHDLALLAMSSPFLWTLRRVESRGARRVRRLRVARGRWRSSATSP